MSVVLRQLGVALQQNGALIPLFHVALAWSPREGGRLVALDMGNVLLDLLLQLAHGLANLCHSPVGTKFSVAVALVWAPSQDYAHDVMRETDAMGQNRVGRICVGERRALVHARIAQCLDNL